MQSHKRQSTTTEYSNLVDSLNPNGNYQLLLTFILCSYWFVSGLVEAFDEIDISVVEEEWLFVVEGGGQVLIIWLVGAVSFRLSRYMVNVLLFIFLTIGSITLLTSNHSNSDTSFKAGQTVIILCHYASSINIFMIALDYFPSKLYVKLVCLAITSFTIGKIFTVFVRDRFLNTDQFLYLVVMPCWFIYFLSFFGYAQSPRYYFDNDIEQSQKIIRSICKFNKIDHKTILPLLERQFFWNKIRLKKYSLGAFLNYKSLNYNTYNLMVCFVMIGLVSRCPDFIIHLQEELDTSVQVEDDVEVLWISCFQLFGLLPAYLASRVVRRKSLILAYSLLIFVVCLVIALLHQSTVEYSTRMFVSFAMVGLNAFFAISMYYTLFLSGIQFYPLTIRTSACAFLFGCQKLGRLLFSLHTDLVGSSSLLLEVVIIGSILLVFHSSLVEETYGGQMKYQIREIEKVESEELL